MVLVGSNDFQSGVYYDSVFIQIEYTMICTICLRDFVLLRVVCVGGFDREYFHAGFALRTEGGSTSLTAAIEQSSLVRACTAHAAERWCWLNHDTEQLRCRLA